MQATDQLNRTIEFNFPPRRIISLVPSQSELLWYLGLRDELVGITKFCIHPGEMFQTVTRVGGTKELKFDEIKKLQPDLIIANKEENEQEQIEELCKHYPVWISDIYNLEDALQMITGIGEITGREANANELAASIIEKHEIFKDTRPKARTKKSAAYLIWKNPYMAAGHNTFINYMLGECGLNNVFTNEMKQEFESTNGTDFSSASFDLTIKNQIQPGQKSRYPEVTTQMLIDKNPDIILLSSEPYPFKQKHMDELQIHLPHAKILLADGEMFSWYGSRLQYAFDYFQTSIIPNLR